MFKAKTSRTLLTVLGMGVGISAILFLVSLGYGLQNTILERITTSDSILTLDVSPQKSSPAVLDQETLNKMKKINGVSEISPVIQLNVQAKFEELKSELSVNAINPSYFKLSGIRPTQGKAISEDNPEEIIIGSAVGNIFNKTPDEMIGKEIRFVFFVPESPSESARIKRVELDRAYKIVGYIDNGESSVYLNYASLGDLGLVNFDMVKVRCQSDVLMSEVDSEIQDMGFSVSSISETVNQTNKVFTVIKIILMLFGTIALVVSAIGMFNTMTITLLERTEEIGIMKSIGASDTIVSLIFIMESVIMGLLGGLAGIIIGWVEGKIFNFGVNLIASQFGGQKVDLFYTPLWFVIIIIIFSAIVGFLTGIVPARRASKIDPLEALRYK